MTPSWPAFGLAGEPGGQIATAAWVRRLLIFFATCLAVPVFEVPLFGLSVSSPLFCFIALECAWKPVEWRRYRGWVLLGGLFWMAHLFSLSANVFSGRLAEISLQHTGLLARLGFWMLVFVVTTALVHCFGHGPNLARALAAGALALGALRVTEAVVFGHWGGGNPQFLSQNDYGFGFSAFTPFVVWLLIESRGWKKLLAYGGCLALLAAVIGNGSRSSWITVGLGLLLMWILWGFRPRRFRRDLAGFLFFSASLAAAVWLAPPSLRDPVMERAGTFERLDRDKPLLARQLLVRKGLALFQESPVFGAGAGRFTQTVVALEIPRTLSYRSAEEFNRKSPHNSYIKVLAETGLFGGASLGSLLILLLWRGLPAALALARHGETWAIPVFTGFITMSIHLWTLSGLTGTAPWFLYGVLAGVIEIHRTACASRLARWPPFAAPNVPMGGGSRD